MIKKEKEITTRKKVKVVGIQEYINKNTGEVETMNVVSIEERDANFNKIWLGHIINSIELIGNQKTRLAFWFLDNLDRENQIVMTQRQIAEKTGISLKTVTQTIKILTNSDFLVKINVGAYRINPDMLFKGGKVDRLNVLMKYQNEKQKNNDQM